MARGVGTATADVERAPSVITIIATHVTTDEMHVVSGSEAEVFVALRARFPMFASSPDLVALLGAIGGTHFVALLPGRVSVRPSPVRGHQRPDLRLAASRGREDAIDPSPS